MAQPIPVINSFSLIFHLLIIIVSFLLNIFEVLIYIPVVLITKVRKEIIKIVKTVKVARSIKLVRKITV